MSREIALNPAQARRAPRRTTPAAGPDTSAQAGCAAASSIVATPPDERITSGVGSPAAEARSPSAVRYLETTGPRYASTAVVDARSYSRNSGATSWEATTRTPGKPAAQLVGHGALVTRVPECEEQADRHGLDVTVHVRKRG